MIGHFPGDMHNMLGHFPLSDIGKAVSRYLAKLDPVLQSHFIYAKTIVASENDTYEFDFVAPTALTTGDQFLLDGDTTEDRTYVILTNEGPLNVNDAVISQVQIDENVGVHPYSYPTDGKHHTMKLTLKAGARIKVKGSRYTLVNFFNGELANPKHTDNSDQQNPVVTEWTLGNVPAIDLYQYSGELVGKGTFETDLSLTSNGNTWTFDFTGGFTSILRDMDFFSGLEGGTFQIISTVVAVRGISQMYLGSTGDTQNLTDGQNTFTLKHGGDARLQIATGDFEGSITLEIREIINHNEVEASKNIEYSKGTTFGGELTDVGLYTVEGGLSTLIDDTSFRILSDVSGNSTLIRVFPPSDTKIYTVKFKTVVTAGAVTVNTSDYIPYDGYHELVIPSGGLLFKRGNGGETNDVLVSDLSIREMQGNAAIAVNILDANKKKVTKTTNGWLVVTQLLLNSDFSGGFLNGLASDWFNSGGATVSDEGDAQGVTDGNAGKLVEQSFTFVEGYTYELKVRAKLKSGNTSGFVRLLSAVIGLSANVIEVSSLEYTTQTYTFTSQLTGSSPVRLFGQTGSICIFKLVTLNRLIEIAP